MREKKQNTLPHSPAGLFSKQEITALLLIVALGIVVYGRCITFDYVLYDDPNILFQNQKVMEGFSPSGVYWAFTNPNFGLYQPLPTISYMIEREFFRDWPGGYHLMTMLWHLFCACTLFIVLFRLLNNLPVALVTALFFTVHPVQAMVVNWIVARNEIMPTAFMLLSVEAYRRYAVNRSWPAYGASLGCMLLALLSKQGAVMLPALLLLLDYWPLRRIKVDFHEPLKTAKVTVRLVVEKLPWFALTGVGVGLAFFGKTQFGVLDKNNLMSPFDNLGFAFTAYIRYLFHLIYPVNYTTAYSTATEWLTPWTAFGALTILIVLTVVALLFYARRPYLIVGWAWFVLLLLPVSGLVRYNSESIALRYLYAPAIGLYLILSCLLYELFKPGDACREAEDRKSGSVPVAYKLLVAGITLAMAVLCFWQSGFWRDSETLALRAIVATNNTNAIAQNHLGEIRIRQGLVQQAEAHMRKAMELEPNLKQYTYNYVVLLLRLKRYQETIDLLEPLLAENDKHALIIGQYGAALLGLERHEEARKCLEQAVQLEPEYVPALFNLAFSLAQQNEKDKARPYLERVLQLQPDHQSARALLDSLN